MKVAIVGYGRMGHEIEEILSSKGIESINIDPHATEANFQVISKESLKNIDVAIDFTHPSAVMENIQKYADIGVNAVIGTTGWYDSMDEAKSIVEKSGIGLIWSANFSIGVNMFFRMVKNASEIIDKIDDYDVFLHEFHHNKKADSPSGTAGMIGKILLEGISRKSRLVHEKLNRRIEPDEIHVTSTRAGSIPGTHIVGFDSEADSIELKHTARNRKGFAIGAVMAAKFIYGKKGFYGIDDLMDSIIGGE